jgi:ElaB/YqjD/DUF883 family membrane-anchored ribosome-binding protein
MATKDMAKKVSAAKKKLAKEFSKARKALAKQEKAMGKYIKSNPKKSIAVAAGLGAVIAGGIATAVIKHRKKRR